MVLEIYTRETTRTLVTAQVGKSEEPSDYEGDVGVGVDSATRTATDNVLALNRRIEFWDKEFARLVLDKILEFTGLAVPR